MKYTTTVTQKGQITLPKAIRDALNIKQYDRVILTLRDKLVEVKSAPDILQLAGTVVPRKNKSKSALEGRAAMEKEYKRF